MIKLNVKAASILLFAFAAAFLAETTDKYQRKASQNDLILYQRLGMTAAGAAGGGGGGGGGGGDCSSPYNFRCRNGDCINSIRRCDGTVDCPDGTDETFHLCKGNRCPRRSFRCAYGACVDEAALCNGVKDCADDSDEYSCRGYDKGISFRCDDGHLIALFSRCDGELHCRDGSDETARACEGYSCSAHQFQCAYGACVDRGALCDRVFDCVDGSDETHLLCTRTIPRTGTSLTASQPSTCVMPEHPDHGWYVSHGDRELRPGVSTPTLVLDASCDPGYRLVGSARVMCDNGTWSTDGFPSCVRTCKLEKSANVEYRCRIDDPNSEETRECQEHVPEGVIVEPRCRPHYYPAVELAYMCCINGQWNYKPVCAAECGTLPSGAQALIAGGRPAARGEVPWHAGLYKLGLYDKFEQICGGSLVSTRVVLSAAHCIWNELEQKKYPESQYAVAVGNLYRQWGHPHDERHAQRSEVQDIYLSEYYSGSETFYENDLAIVVVATAFEYRLHVQPVCLSFDYQFNEALMQKGNLGKVAGWGQTGAGPAAADTLKVLELPVVPTRECKRRTPVGYRSYLVGEKICAGFHNGTSLRRGDSGGGLAFPTQVQGVTRYFLLGIVSSKPPRSARPLRTITRFERVAKHETMIKQHWTP